MTTSIKITDRTKFFVLSTDGIFYDKTPMFDNNFNLSTKTNSELVDCVGEKFLVQKIEVSNVINNVENHKVFLV